MQPRSRKTIQTNPLEAVLGAVKQDLHLWDHDLTASKGPCRVTVPPRTGSAWQSACQTGGRFKTNWGWGDHGTAISALFHPGGMDGGFFREGRQGRARNKVRDPQPFLSSCNEPSELSGQELICF